MHLAEPPPEPDGTLPEQELARNGQRTCNLCGGRRFRCISQTDRHGRPLETGICEGCGLVAHAAIPTAAELDAYYAKHYRREYHDEWSPSPKRVMRAWKNGIRIQRSMAPYLKGGESILDVGAGIGCTVKAFEQQGFDAHGIEPGQGFQAYARAKLGACVDNLGLFELDRPARYDLVVLIHVIEHFASPSRAFEAIGDLLRPGGRLLVECPNLAAPFAVRRRLFHYAHIYNFTPWTLIPMAQKSGFEVEARLGSEWDPNLRVLLRHTPKRSAQIDPMGCRRTMERIERYNPITYHLRWSYLRTRAAKLLSYAHEGMVASRFVGRVCGECARGTRHDEASAEPPAASGASDDGRSSSASHGDRSAA